MPLMTRFPKLLGTAAMAAMLSASFAPAYAADATPGVTPTEIIIGGTHPYSGPASAYGVIGKAIIAYFDYINDTQHGVNGRKLTYIDKDDAYSPPQTKQVVKELVEQDHVFAMMNTLGTTENLAIRDYLAEQKVPQLFISSGATQWGRDAAKYPMVLGFNLDYYSEAYAFGKNIVQHEPNAKVAIIYQNDDLGQDMLTGIKAGMGAKASQIVKIASYETTDPDVRSQMASLKGSGADTLFVAATPKFAAGAMSSLGQLSWKPTLYLTNISNSAGTMAAAAAAGANLEGTISDAYNMDPKNPDQQNSPNMKLYRMIIAKYGKGLEADNIFVPNGMAAAYAMVDALQHAGKNPTRESLVNAALHMNEKNNPFLYPGVTLVTTPADHFPIRSAQLLRFTKGEWVANGPVIDARQ